MSPILNADLHVNQIRKLCPDLLAGMYSPRVVTLTGGTVYKFTSAKVPAAARLASPWWFDETEFRKLDAYLKLDPGNVAFLARTQGAVKYEWSDMDTLIAAHVAAPIRVFSGPGKWQLETTKTGSHIAFQAPADLLQTYIPNIVDRATRRLNATGRAALRLISTTTVTSGDAIDQAIQTLRGKTIVIPGNPTVQ
ncbi:MAG TPA: hypothetical protein VMM12_18465 [Longimicrobiales bacterium]|nr:hypothetical protein [Longimicrobiales bacterium]